MLYCVLNLHYCEGNYCQCSLRPLLGLPLFNDVKNFCYRENADEYEGLPEIDKPMGEEESRDPRYILGRKLLTLGKVNFRHIENLPGWLTDRMKV